MFLSNERVDASGVGLFFVQVLRCSFVSTANKESSNERSHCRYTTRCFFESRVRTRKCGIAVLWVRCLLSRESGGIAFVVRVEIMATAAVDCPPAASPASYVGRVLLPRSRTCRRLFKDTGSVFLGSYRSFLAGQGEGGEGDVLSRVAVPSVVFFYLGLAGWM